MLQMSAAERICQQLHRDRDRAAKIAESKSTNQARPKPAVQQHLLGNAPMTEPTPPQNRVPINGQATRWRPYYVRRVQKIPVA